MVSMAQSMQDVPGAGTAAGTPGAEPIEHRIVVPASVPMVALLGSRDEFLRVVEDAFGGTTIHVRGNEITVTGQPDEVALVERLVDELVVVLRTGQPLSAEAIERSISMLRSTGFAAGPADVLTFNVLSNRGRTIRPKTLNQKKYVDAIDQHTVVFGIGPAGTGKTYLAVAKAVQALQSKQVTRIILTRPAVEAGERLGFLPGTLYEKIDPYLRPLYDALHDMLDPDSIPRLMAAGTIEVAPLAYMRGRAQPVGTPVLTPQGFRPIGTLQVGDLVVGSDGQPTPVLGVYPQGRKQVFRLATADGACTLACGEHLWFVTTADGQRRGERPRVLATAEMIGNVPDAQYQLPLVGPVQMEPRDVPIDPYALGLRLGESRTTPATARGSAPAGSVPEPLRGGVLVADPVRDDPTNLGWDGARSVAAFVPVEYLHNCVDVRLAVLQGLLDTDGDTGVAQGRTGRIQYRTCSQRLRDDVVYLVRSLGGVAHTTTDPAPGRTPAGTAARPGSDSTRTHVVDIRLPAGIAPFRQARKAASYDVQAGGGPVRTVESVEPAGDSECVCIAVAAPDSLYVTEDFLVTHNTLNDAFIILDEAQNTTPEQMKMFLTRLGFSSKMVVTGDVTQTDLPGGTRSGLNEAQDVLAGIQDVAFLRLTSKDVVRHRLVSDIVDAYGRHDSERAAAAAPAPRKGGHRPADRR